MKQKGKKLRSSEMPTKRRCGFLGRSAYAAAAGITVLLLCSDANAGFILQDFESYADSTALNADISFTNSNATVALNTTMSVTPGSQSLELTSTNGSSPYYGVAELEVPLTSLFSVPQVDVWFKSGGGSGERLEIQLKDQFGSTLVTSTNVSKATQDYPNWTVLSIDTTGTTSGLKKVAIFLKAQDYGTGTILIDNITIIPEPATFASMGLGTLTLLAFRRRRK